MLHICVAIIIIRYNNSFYIEAARTAAKRKNNKGIDGSEICEMKRTFFVGVYIC